MSLEALLAAGEGLSDNQRPFGLPEVRALLLQHQPGFASLLFGLYKHVFVEGKLLTTAATDGKHLIFSRKLWEQLDVPSAAFITAHEIMHGVLEHPSRMVQLRSTGIDNKPFDKALYNDAADYVINDLLVQSGLPMPKLPGGNSGLLDRSIGTGTDDVETVYRKLYKDQQGKGQGQGQGQGQGSEQGQGQGQGQGEHQPQALDTLLDPAQDAPSTQTIKREVASALATAKAQGAASAALTRVFDNILQPKVDWRFLLRNAFHASRGRTRTSWRRINRRYAPQGIILPGRDGTALGTVVVAFDTSGSVSNRELEAYLAEATAILEETRPKELWAIPCDAAVHNARKLSTPAELTDFAKQDLRGGGGTSFVPVFEWVEQKNLKPEVLIYCTDMYGTFPTGARYPVVWVATSDRVAPFGRTIKIDE